MIFSSISDQTLLHLIEYKLWRDQYNEIVFRYAFFIEVNNALQVLFLSTVHNTNSPNVGVQRSHKMSSDADCPRGIDNLEGHIKTCFAI